jgi:prophage regulatory protein
MDRIVSENEAKQLTGLSKTTRWRMEKKGTFPARIKLGENRVGWKYSDIANWISTRPLANISVASGFQTV